MAKQEFLAAELALASGRIFAATVAVVRDHCFQTLNHAWKRTLITCFHKFLVGWTDVTVEP